VDWTREQHDWPMAEQSRFVISKPHKWHVQEAGTGPLVLLLHGAGGATQSWRHLFPLLAAHYRVIAIDLPGQGFTRSGASRRFGLAEMAQDIAALCVQEEWQPRVIIGHSAGGALAFELADLLADKPHIIGINAALAPFKGVAGMLFPLMAKALAKMPLVATLFTASTGNPRSVQRLIDGTGSHLPPEDLTYYQRLVGDRNHADATLKMMAQWDLDPLLRRLSQSEIHGFLIAAEQDKAVPAITSVSQAAKMANVDCVVLPDLGHLIHEEAPEVVFDLITQNLRDNGIMARA
jgi:magnesium chelatase accessory protein